ncbi:MAG: sugar porter family MFS transporter [Muribaculaceae bacterium]|nr:sugar porter family MFS transporter [Muribaculaceae bacterium]
MKNDINLGYLFFISFVAALGGFLFGYDTAVISGTISQVSSQFGLDAFNQGWYVGCALLGSIGGVAVAGMLGDKLGRKRAMIVSAVLFSASAIGCALSGTFGELVLWRIVGGAGIGVASIICPLYISELAAAEYRGRLVSLYQLAVTIGFVGAYLVNYGLLNYSLSGADATGAFGKIFVSEVWRGMLGMETLPAVLFFVIIFFIPESPRWLLAHKHEQRGREVLQRVFTSADAARAEVAAVEASLKAAAASAAGSQWRLLLRPRMLRAVLIGTAIAILGQFMGVNAVLYYGPTIFEDAGLSAGDSLFYQVMVGAVNTLTTVAALLLIDKVGRKQLVYWGVSGMIVSLLLIAGYFTYGASLGLSSLWLLTFFLIYIMCCAGSICAVVFVLLSEMYPMKIRAMAMSVAGFALWVGTYLVGQLTPWLMAHLSAAGVFLLFALMCVPYMLIMWRAVPETTGKSLEEIEKFWEDDPEGAAAAASDAADAL